ISKTDGVASVNAGGSTTYTVRVTNGGPSSVTGAILSDLSASGLAKTSVACSGTTPGQCVTAPTVAQLQSGTFALPALTNGQFYEITVDDDVTATSGSVTNTATIAAPSGTTDPTPGNNSASDTDTVTPVADLTIGKSAPATAIAGASAGFDYTLTVTNNGPSSHTGNLSAYDTLPTGTTFQSTGSSSECTAALQVVTCTRSVTLAVGGTT